METLNKAPEVVPVSHLSISKTNLNSKSALASVF